MLKNKVLQIDKIIEIIVGLILLLRGHIAFGITLITFGLITIHFEL